MFTGIIRKTAKVKIGPAPSAAAADGAGLLEIFNPKLRLKTGDSIAVNGVCSTVLKARRVLTFQYMPETLRRSTAASLKAGDEVNLEESLRPSDSLSGHIVLGHVDTVGVISEIQNEGNSKILTVEPRNPEKFMKFVAEKGSVAVDGVSLTVASVGAKNFTVKLIPYTLKHTAFGKKKIGGMVNLEFDILAKYLERLICK